MTKGKPWPPEKEKELRELVAVGAHVDVIAAKLGKSRGAILKKAERLGLEVVVTKNFSQTTTSELDLGGELPSVEDVLKLLNAALKELQKPGLDKTEVSRLRSIIVGCKMYKELLADYIDYRAIETKLIELEAKYEQLRKEKAKGYAPKPNSAHVVPTSTK